MNKYLEQLNKIHLKVNLSEIEEYATAHQVPIIATDSLYLLLAILNIKKAKRILEIGTAIGYSAIAMAQISEECIIDTIEKDSNMYHEAQRNVSLYQLDKRINIILSDALEVNLNLLKKYDLIFIDAAKAQYQKFFERFSPLLNEDGIIITDNILFHGCVENRDNLSRNVRNLVNKIDNYNQFLRNLNDYNTFYIDSGDGLAITVRKTKCG